MTVIPGTWTSTATATSWHWALVTTLFQEMDTHSMPHAALLSAGGYSNSKKWATSTTLPHAEFPENLFVTKDCCIPGNRHQLLCHPQHLDLHLDPMRLTMNSVFGSVVLMISTFPWYCTFPGTGTQISVLSCA